ARPSRRRAGNRRPRARRSGSHPPAARNRRRGWRDRCDGAWVSPSSGPERPPSRSRSRTLVQHDRIARRDAVPGCGLLRRDEPRSLLRTSFANLDQEAFLAKAARDVLNVLSDEIGQKIALRPRSQAHEKVHDGALLHERLARGIRCDDQILAGLLGEDLREPARAKPRALEEELRLAGGHSFEERNARALRAEAHDDRDSPAALDGAPGTWILRDHEAARDVGAPLLGDLGELE